MKSARQFSIALAAFLFGLAFVDVLRAADPPALWPFLLGFALVCMVVASMFKASEG